MEIDNTAIDYENDNFFIYEDNNAKSIIGIKKEYQPLITKIIVPDDIEKIVANWFLDCPNVEKIFIPASVKRIVGEWDQDSFPQLKEIIADENNQYYRSIGNTCLWDKRNEKHLLLAVKQPIKQQKIEQVSLFECEEIEDTCPDNEVNDLVIPSKKQIKKKREFDSTSDFPEELLDDRDTFIAIVKASRTCFSLNIPNKFRNDKEIMILCISKYRGFLDDASDDLKNDIEVVSLAASDGCFMLENASEALRDNKELVMRAVLQNPFAISLVSDRLKKDKDILTATFSCYAYDVCTDKTPIDCIDIGILLNNRELLLLAANRYGFELLNKCEALKDDKEFVKYVVANNGSLLSYVSDRLKDDKEFVKEVVANNGSLLSYVSDRLKDDKEVVLLAVSDYGNAIKYASEELQKDEEIIKVSKEHWYDDSEVLFGPDDLPF